MKTGRVARDRDVKKSPDLRFTCDQHPITPRRNHVTSFSLVASFLSLQFSLVYLFDVAFCFLHLDLLVVSSLRRSHSSTPQPILYILCSNPPSLPCSTSLTSMPAQCGFYVGSLHSTPLIFPPSPLSHTATSSGSLP